MSSPDERIARELRAARPTAPPELRQRVEALKPDAERAPLAPRLPVRRVGLALAAACVVGGVGAALIHGVVAGSETTRRAHPLVTVAHGQAAAPAPNLPLDAKKARAPGPVGQPFSAVLTRLQRRDVELRLRVRDVARLSEATASAIQTTRHLGGYIASANYNEPTARRGVSRLVVMVPVDRVQQAIGRFSKLGTIVAQHIAIADLQRQVDEEGAALARLERAIKRARAALSGPLAAGQRAVLERHLASGQRRLRALLATRTATVRRASFARIALTLVTKKVAAARPGRLDRTLGDAGSVLVSEAEFLLYALVVGGPLLLLGALGLVAARGARRRADGRLLERT